MKRILVPTDFSAHSTNACHYAAALAKVTGAKMRLVHVIPQPSAVGVTPDAPYAAPLEDYFYFLEKLEGQDKLAFESLYQELKAQEADGVEVEYAILHGEPVTELEVVCENYQPDLVVVGVKPRSEAYRFFIGSVASRLINHVNAPLLAIPPYAKFDPIEHCIFASDYDIIDGNALDQLRALLAPIGPKISYVHMMEGATFYHEELEEAKAELQEHIQTFTGEIDPEAQLISGDDLLHKLDGLLDHKNTDLLVFVHVKHGFFFRLFNPSLSKQMMFITHKPLLILQGGKA